jgi:hypothetical protein
LTFSRALANQQAGISSVSPSNNSAAVVAPSPVAVAAPTTAPISSIYAGPTSTFYPANINANSSTTNNRTATSIPVLGNQEQQHSEQVQLYQKQLEKKNLNSSTVPGSGLAKEERAKQLKAAFEEQQRALRLAYEKSLRDAQEQDREEQSFSPDSAAITSDLSKVKVTAASTTCNSSSNTKIPSDTISPAEQLQRSYEAHLASLRRDEQQQASLKPSPKPPPSTSTSTSVAPRIENVQNRPENQQKTKKQEQPIQEKAKTPDEEAGTILLGFLNSLRESFQDAVESKDGRKITTEGRNDYDNKNEKYVAANPATDLIPTDNANNNKEPSTAMTGVSSDLSSRNRGRRNSNNHSSNIRRQNSDPMTSLSHFQTSKKRKKIKPASVTETSSSTSSHPTTEQSSNSSSQEDSKSDKMGNSSSEESSEKESVESSTTTSRRTSKGPPRKRLKGFHESHEFTRENLMAHSKRMDRECEESRSSSSSDE